MKRVLLLFSIVFAFVFINVQATNHVGKIPIIQTVDVIHADNFAQLQDVNTVNFEKILWNINMQDKGGGYQTDILKYPKSTLSYINIKPLNQKNNRVDNLRYNVTIKKYYVAYNSLLILEQNKKYSSGSQPILCLDKQPKTYKKIYYSPLGILIKTQGRMPFLCNFS